jgi:predicted CoA-binding protein
MCAQYENFADPADIAAILNMKRIAVVGLSSNPSRPSHGVARYLQEHEYEIIPVNPHETEVLGRRAYASLLDLPEPPEVVDVFRRPEYVDQIVDEAIAVGAKALWLQIGVVNLPAARRARQAGLITVMDRCMLVEHARMLRSRATKAQTGAGAEAGAEAGTKS